MTAHAIYPAEYHAILWHDRRGEHWVCACGRWRFDCDRPLDDDAVSEILRGEYLDHTRFEDIYGEGRWLRGAARERGRGS